MWFEKVSSGKWIVAEVYEVILCNRNWYSFVNVVPMKI